MPTRRNTKTVAPVTEKKCLLKHHNQKYSVHVPVYLVNFHDLSVKVKCTVELKSKLTVLHCSRKYLHASH